MTEKRNSKQVKGESFDDIVLGNENSIAQRVNAILEGSTETPTEEPSTGFDWTRAFRYRPTSLTAEIIKVSATDANIDRNDVVSIALFLLQIATEDQLDKAFAETFSAKAKDLSRSLRGG